jgi:hypothetical protein
VLSKKSIKVIKQKHQNFCHIFNRDNKCAPQLQFANKKKGPPVRSQPFKRKKKKKRGPNSVGRGQSSKYVMLVSRKENEQIAI